MDALFRSPRILLAIPVAVCAGIALHTVIGAVPGTPDPGLIVVAYLLALLVGYLISLLARPKHAASFIFWPLLVFIGLTIPLVLDRDSLSDPATSVLLNLLLTSSASIGGALPGRRPSALSRQSLDPKSARSIPYLLAVSFLSGVNLYWWGLFFLWRFEALEMLTAFLTCVALFPVLVGWISFSITRAAGPAGVERFTLWPIVIVSGMFIACLFTAYPLGSDASDILLIGPLIIPALIGSAIPTYRFARLPRADVPPPLPY